MNAPQERLRRTLRLSVIEGSVVALVVGFGEFYFLADAIRLGGSPAAIALVATLPPFLGSLGALAMVEWMRRLPHRRPLVAAAALLQSLVLATLALLDGTGLSTPWTLLVLACVYQAFGQAAGTAWTSWIGDVVPSRLRGVYFSRRTRWIHVTSFLALIAAGLLLQILEPAPGAPGGGHGFAVVLGIAALARFVSALMLWRSWEPPFEPLDRSLRVHHFLLGPEGRAARRLLPLAGGFLFWVTVASPFFAPYQLQELRFGYAAYMLGQAVLVAAKVVGLPAWGRSVDRMGAAPTYALAVLLAALIPLPWLWAEGLLWVLPAQAISGAAWGGYEVSLFAVLLATSDAKRRPLLFASQSVLNGGAQLLGGLVGTALFPLLGFRGIFAASLLGRLLVAAAAPHVLASLGPMRRVRRRDVLLRVIGVRANAGPVHRPVLLEPERVPVTEVKPEAARARTRG